MACTAPINIVKNVKNICDNKCKYSFLYPMTNLVVTNKTTYLEFKCDTTDQQPVTFNAGKYNVTDFRIYSPSLHTFGNEEAEGERLRKLRSPLRRRWRPGCSRRPSPARAPSWSRISLA